MLATALVARAGLCVFFGIDWGFSTDILSVEGHPSLFIGRRREGERELSRAAAAKSGAVCESALAQD